MLGDLSAAPPAAGYRTLIDLLWQDAELAMMVVDAEQRVRHANPTALELFATQGFSIGTRFFDQINLKYYINIKICFGQCAMRSALPPVLAQELTLAPCQTSFDGFWWREL